MKFFLRRLSFPPEELAYCRARESRDVNFSITYSDLGPFGQILRKIFRCRIVRNCFILNNPLRILSFFSFISLFAPEMESWTIRGSRTLVNSQTDRTLIRVRVTYREAWDDFLYSSMNKT